VGSFRSSFNCSNSAISASPFQLTISKRLPVRALVCGRHIFGRHFPFRVAELRDARARGGKPRGEFLTGIYGRAGEFVDRSSFVTIRSNYSSFDEIERAAEQFESGGNPFFRLAPPGYKIREWFGRSGSAVDAVGIIAEPEPALPKTGFQQYKLGAVGGWGGEAFSDQEVAPLAGVSKIKVTERGNRCNQEFLNGILNFCTLRH
jgi:hypothetical protein